MGLVVSCARNSLWMMNGTANVNLGTFFLSYTFKDLDFESNIF